MTPDTETTEQSGSGTGPNVRKTPAADSTGVDTSTLLQTEGLTKRFGGLTAIDSVDFAIEEGELRCLIGPNGAGKSTLLKLITGRHDATEGRIYYDGADVTEFSPHERVRRGIGIKFQSPAVFDSLTSSENIRMAIQRTEDGDFSDSIRSTLERVGLADKGDVLASDLSHGQQQRLEIGMTIALSPSLLLLDEPVAGLSMEEREEIADLVRTLNDDGLTLIVIEHDIDFVDRIADQVTVLNQGEIFQEGSIDEIRSNEEVRRIYLGDA
ncbi:ABC transporter ATP-binding protein [Halomicroarcula sp. GCM10025324]|jgi:branched-chain amino acid transport system ATP-binding protein|uniref:ABC transporter ATP-binding protein n=1 Tax=Haloarcula TaxID=2237 RepID=UPI0023E7B976|nr:ABC transporter ATP-binding protein [Halomicroarcula sp. ZS-22-S1]